MKKYDGIEIEIARLDEADVVRTSYENADDIGGWNDAWFTGVGGNDG